MMSLVRIDAFLEKTIGLSPEAVGSHAVVRAVDRRTAELGLHDLTDYAARLTASPEEQTALLEAVIVPETWFFRNRKAFHFLAEYATGTWLKENPGRRLRVLSLPCSTGEEAYSIVMSLRDKGISFDQFVVHGVDISESALATARAGLYGQASFRGDELSFRDRYLDPEGEGYRLHDDIRSAVRFMRGNVLDDRTLAEQGPYDVIFCRNLLIYMSRRARQRTLQLLNRLLADGGILFLGHAEREAAVSFGLVGIPVFGVFACRKERRKRPADPCHPRRRRFEKIGMDLLPAGPPAQENLAAQVSDPAPPDQGHDRSSRDRDDTDLFDRAQQLADRGALREALELCRHFLKDHPTHVGAYFLMGLIHEAMDSEEEAEESFNRAIYLDPCHWEALNHLAYILEDRGDRGQAAHLRERAQRAVQQRGSV